MFYCDRNLWEKLEEIPPENWDDFSDLFSRAPVAAKPVKAKTEKSTKQQTVKSNLFFSFYFTSFCLILTSLITLSYSTGSKTISECRDSDFESTSGCPGNRKRHLQPRYFTHRPGNFAEDL